ncbi:MAG: asparagine synthase (glutamine-hydrolyzing) [Phycisphaerae bacterium]|nr:asparagine synthase (glutamine-hydrolyzing) [Phycisphaerae bacterium]
MCGIAGVLKIHDPGSEPPPHHEAIPEEWLDILDDSIKRRGPDGAGRFRDRATRADGTIVDVALVHRRLSIIDHEGGAQPMVHVRHPDGAGELIGFNSIQAPGASLGRSHTTPPPDDPPLNPPKPPVSTIDATSLPPETDLVAVAFNGCVYNHRELRAELESQGHVFCTDHSDTEVLVHGWRAWGLYMQDEIDGMYAALIWDRRAGQLAWGRDVAGEKPLYEANSQRACFYSTSVVGLASAGARIDQIATTPYLPGFRWWLSHGSMSIPTTPCFEKGPATFSVAPPSPNRGGAPPVNVTDHPARLQQRRITLPVRDASGRSFGASMERNIEIVEHAIRSRLEADVPLGVFLSGGIDSALIAAIAKQSAPDLKTFTVRMPDPRLDESDDAAETARVIGTDHRTLECEPRPAEDLVRLIEQLGLPFGDSSLLPTYWVARAARNHVKVALSGDGADELFGGYRRHQINRTLNRGRHLLKLIPTAILDQRRPASRSTYVARLAVAARHGGYSELLSIFPTPDLKRVVSIDNEDLGASRLSGTTDPLRDDFEHYLPDDLLRKTDTAAMAVGLEVRAPFLARDLIDAALRTPLSILMPNGQRKGLLKQIARRYLPDHIVDRPKRGFAIPIGEWFRSDYGGLRQLLHDHLLSADPFPGLGDAGVHINMAYVRRLLREHDRAGEPSISPWHGRDHSQRLYMLLVLSIWARWLDRVRRASNGPTGPGDSTMPMMA